jgi:hypothetical protein
MIDLSQLFLIQTLKTGIFSLDIIIIISFIIFQNYSHIVNLIQKLLNIDRVSKVVQKIHNRIMYKNTVFYTGLECKSCGYSIKIGIDYPDQVLATIDYIISSSNAQKYNLQYIEQYEKMSGITNKFYMPLSNYPIEIENDIFFVKEKTFKEYTTTECKGEYSDVKFIFFSSTKTSHEIKKLIEKYLEIYKAKIDEKLSKNIYYFTYGTTNNSLVKTKRFSDDEQEKLYWSEYVLTTNRTFDNVFFKKKELILSRLNFFMENQEWYNKRGIPYTLGFLFKGPPGCGKTSTIKAIANFTKRHVFEIRLSEIKNINELHNIFFSDTVNEKTIPISKRLYVFEELDCILDIIKKRAATTKNEIGDMQLYTDLLKKCGGTTEATIPSQIAEMKPKILHESIDIGQLLSLFDGVLESPGRMMIFTTNHADKIDDALKRPGRIDEEIEFSLCDAEMIRHIIELFYDCKIPETTTFEKYTDTFSPAEITKMCFNNDYDKLLSTFI